MRAALPLVLVVLLLQVTGCSTFSGINPFSKEEVVDYNALTYGDDYKDGRGQTREWTSTKSGHDAGDPQAAATAKMTRDPAASYYGKDDDLDPRQDPTDENVRRRVAIQRGQAVSNYKSGDRATKNDFYDTSANDGSLWANDQDSNYFFTKDKVRTLGDIVSVKIDDAIIRHIAEEVKKNLTPAEQEVEMAIYLKNSDGAKGDKDIQAYRNVAAEELKTSEAAQVKDKMEKAVRWSQVDLTKSLGLAANEELRAEIVDRYQNGNYKIKATKRIVFRGSSKMVSLVGVAPATDFDDKDQIASGKLYETRIKVAR